MCFSFDVSVASFSSISSKSLNLQKRRVQNSMTYFFKLNDLKESLATFLCFHKLDFSEILNICQNYSLFYITAHFMM